MKPNLTPMGPSMAAIREVWTRLAWVTAAMLAGSTLACGGGGGGGGPTSPPPPAGDATVRATVSANGEATDGVRVRILEPGSDKSVQTQTTDAQGRATFTGLDPGSYDVRVDVPADLGVPAGEDVLKRVTANAGQTADVDFGLAVIDPPEFGEVVDIDGNAYRTVTIGGQTWMADNLTVATYRNGDPIPEARTDAEWTQARVDQRGAWSNYENDAANGEAYGKLYNNYAVLDPRGLCPDGWRVPGDGDFHRLERFIGMTDAEVVIDSDEQTTPTWRGEVGGKLKSTRTDPAPHPRWDDPNTGASNTTGFSSLPGGLRRGVGVNEGTFNWRGIEGVYWTSTVGAEAGEQWARALGTNASGIWRGKQRVDNAGLSVRCVRS